MPDAGSSHEDLHAERRDPALPRINHPTVVAGLLLVLCGCATIAPQQTAPVAVEIPAAWSAAHLSAMTGNPSLAQWWSRFNDPLLSDLVAQALRANPSVSSAQAALRQARALRDVTASALFHG